MECKCNFFLFALITCLLDSFRFALFALHLAQFDAHDVFSDLINIICCSVCIEMCFITVLP
jgi:hypothetical protein